MKRGTPTHPKTLALAASLGIPRYAAVGILESLWHFSAHYARRGDIGRHSDAEIAAGVGWQEDPAVLLGALVRCGWVDACACHRLRVHDWPAHADQAVQKTTDVRSAGFLECYESDSGRISAGYTEGGGSAPSAGIGTGSGTGTGQGRGVEGGAHARRRRKPPKPGDDTPGAREGCADAAEILGPRLEASPQMLGLFARLIREGRTREQWRAVLTAYRDRATSSAAFARDGTRERPGGPGLTWLLRPGEKGGFDTVLLQLQEGTGPPRAAPTRAPSSRAERIDAKVAERLERARQADLRALEGGDG